MSHSDMTLVQMPIAVPHGENQFGRYNPSRTSLHRQNYSSTALENLAALLSSSPTGAFSYLSTTTDGSGSYEGESLNACRVMVGVGTSGKMVQKARSFPKVKFDEPGKSKSCMRENERRFTRSKSVRFADTQGLPLVNVHKLTCEDSSYTKNVIVPYNDEDIFGRLRCSANGLSQPSSLRKTPATPPAAPKRTFNFTQPACEPGFHSRVQAQQVCLESTRSERKSVLGTVCVTNLSFEKHVYVRWTHDAWKTFHESNATYCSGDGHVDKFSFELPANGDDIHFAICYKVLGREYWDNNRGQNYIVFGSSR